MKKLYFILPGLTLMAVLWLQTFRHGPEKSIQLADTGQYLARDSPVIMIYSDPHDPKIMISYASASEEKALISIFYSDGRLLSRKMVTVQKGKNNLEYLLPHSATGIFIVRIASNGKERSCKVYKNYT